MPVDIKFIERVAAELQMKQEDYAKFPEPTNYSKYNRTIIYELTKHHFRLIKSVANFPSHIKKSQPDETSINNVHIKISEI